MDSFAGLTGKFLGGAGILIAIYLILTNPHGDSVAANSLFSGTTSTIKALQGR